MKAFETIRRICACFVQISSQYMFFTELLAFPDNGTGLVNSYLLAVHSAFHEWLTFKYLFQFSQLDVLNFICVELFLKEGAHLLCFLFISFLLPHLSLLLGDQVIEHLQRSKRKIFFRGFYLRITIIVGFLKGISSRSTQSVCLSFFSLLSIDLIGCVCGGHDNPEESEGNDSLP